MKTILAILTLLVSITPQFADASEWTIFGKDTAIGKAVTATVPVGESVTSSPWTSLSLESVNADGSILLRTQGGSSYTGISATIKPGVGSTFRPCSATRYPAIRIKVLSVDFENGTARLEVSQFWPYPNDVQIDSAK